MKIDTDKDLIRMANDIAIFHQSFPENEAVQMVAEHINKFWAPKMRKRLLELSAERQTEFNPLIQKVRFTVKCSELNPVVFEFKEKHGSGG